MIDWEWVWNKALFSISWNYPSAPMEGRSKTTEHLSQDSLCRRDSNCAPPEYKSRSLPLSNTLSVSRTVSSRAISVCRTYFPPNSPQQSYELCFIMLPSSSVLALSNFNGIVMFKSVKWQTDYYQSRIDCHLSPVTLIKNLRLHCTENSVYLSLDSE